MGSYPSADAPIAHKTLFTFWVLFLSLALVWVYRDSAAGQLPGGSQATWKATGWMAAGAVCAAAQIGALLTGFRSRVIEAVAVAFAGALAVGRIGYYLGGVADLDPGVRLLTSLLWAGPIIVVSRILKEKGLL